MVEEKAQLDDEIRTLNHLSYSHQFAYVILDGDGAIFREELIAQGYNGGAEAARMLNNNVRAFLKGRGDTIVGDWKIQVLVVFNQEGLASTLHASGILPGAREKLQAFVQGFNNGQPLFHIEDVGGLKEAADRKVRATFELMAYNRQCRHIIFGGCHDKGYLTWMQEFKGNPDVTKVTLLETQASQRGFDNLGWDWCKFDEVFRTEPIRKSEQTLTPRSPLKRPAATLPTSTSRPNPQQDDGWSPTASSHPANANSGERRSSPKLKVVRPDMPYYSLNAFDERLDEKLPDFTTAGKDEVSSFYPRTLCNFHYLSPQGCTNTSESCKHLHGPPLSPEGLDYLRHLARGIKCSKGSVCRHPDCFFGHHCKNGNGCKIRDCRFAGTHGMDLTPRQRIYADGTRMPV
ncbi:hypothetical protein GQ53DRAFT_746070 [Thozetella sp. PMI_491]|nr:hypothetical protein GQ53DRAFT_746070 [Thozetella sp. PMI_491]